MHLYKTSFIEVCAHPQEPTQNVLCRRNLFTGLLSSILILAKSTQFQKEKEFLKLQKHNGKTMFKVSHQQRIFKFKILTHV